MSKKQYLLVIPFCLVLFSSYSIEGAESSLNSKSDKWDDASREEFNTYNPVVDYLDFQQSESEEEENLNFFKDGRLLSVMFFPAFRYFFPEKAYAPFLNFGASLNHFVNLSTSIQFSLVMGTHNVIHGGQTLGQSSFRTIYTDLKYYWNRDRLIKSIAYFNPFIFVGVLFSQRGTVTYNTEGNRITHSALGVGGRSGLGIEIHISQKFFIGTQLGYEFTPFKNTTGGTDANLFVSSGQQIYLPMSSLLGIIFLGANF